MSIGSRLVVVTGASRGLGLALVREFVSDGGRVVGVGRSGRPKDYPDEGEYAQFDASDVGDCRSFWAGLGLTELSDVCLINNAGLYVRGGFLDTTPELLEESIKGNYLAAAFMTRTLFEVVQSARVVNIISTSALQAKATNSAYGSAKAGIAQFFRSIQQEFPPQKFRITNLYPGTIRTHGEPPDIAAIDPTEFSTFIRNLVASDSSFYVAEATVMPADE